ncbi:RNaseH domain-containing protein [Phormidesmis sp. 146-33]
MAEAQNARRKGLLSWLQNPSLQPDKVLKALQLKDADELNRLWIVRLRLQGSSNETPVAIVKPSLKGREQAGSRARGRIYRWQDICESEQPLYLSLRRSATTEQYALKISQSRLEDGSHPNINARLLEVTVVHHPGIQPDQLALLVHRLRSRYPYSADDGALPFPFPFATAAKEYAVSVRDLVEPDGSEQNVNR